jgi:hypothetical protein
LKASATDFGSEIWHGVVLSSASEKANDTYLQLRAHRGVFVKCQEEETWFIMKLRGSRTKQIACCDTRKVRVVEHDVARISCAMDPGRQDSRCPEFEWWGWR